MSYSIFVNEVSEAVRQNSYPWQGHLKHFSLQMSKLLRRHHKKKSIVIFQYSRINPSTLTPKLFASRMSFLVLINSRFVYSVNYYSRYVFDFFVNHTMRFFYKESIFISFFSQCTNLFHDKKMIKIFMIFKSFLNFILWNMQFRNRDRR